MSAELETPAQAARRHVLEAAALHFRHLAHAPSSPPGCAEDREYLDARRATLERLADWACKQAERRESSTPNDARASRRAEGG